MEPWGASTGMVAAAGMGFRRCRLLCVFVLVVEKLVTSGIGVGIDGGARWRALLRAAYLACVEWRTA